MISKFSLVCVLIIASSCSNQSDGIVFLDNFKLFESFEMKKDLDFKIEGELSAEKNAVSALADSLDKETDPSKKEQLEKNLQEAKLLFDQKFQALSSKYTNEVYAKLNTLISAYGKQKGYKIILGADGQGGVMYVDTTYNITNDMIKYVNDAYAN